MQLIINYFSQTSCRYDDKLDAIVNYIAFVQEGEMFGGFEECTEVFHQRGLLFSGLDYWTGTLDWTTGLTYFWFLHILWMDLRSLASEYPYGTCSPLLNVENEQWNMQKLSSFTTVHYATIHHFLVFSNAAGISAGN